VEARDPLFDLAVALMAFGVATSLALSVLGVLLLAVGLFGWIQELRRG